MCETVAGQLIIGCASRDPAAKGVIDQIKEGQIEHVSYLESMRDRLAKHELTVATNFPFEFHLVAVPYGSEIWKANYLQFFYKAQLLQRFDEFVDPDMHPVLLHSDMHFTVTPNHILSLAQKSGAGTAVTALSFAFDVVHATYRKMINMQAPLAAGTGVRIAVLDTGIAADHPSTVIRSRNFVDPTKGAPATDDHGHGTVVTLIIHDLVPNAELIIYKIADASGRASEWDTVAALASCADADIVNLSLQFGLGDRMCNTCGRESRSSRASVFESTLRHYPMVGKEPVFVAAAGNAADAELAYPARFGEVMAVGSITSAYALSSESNFGDVDHEGMPHQNHFVLPGGDQGFESVGKFGSKGKPWHGTSMACAYATGVVASIMSGPGTPQNASALLPLLRTSADKTSFPAHDAKLYGNGVVRA